ncbi:MAG TPA: hypothetical protein VG013_08305 [Gemmataceae bacterium]|jgi:hypothetical protein|nr:hypothetical protein [Gemmataceae bacterium]
MLQNHQGGQAVPATARPGKSPDKEVLKEIHAKMEKLEAAVTSLRQQGAGSLTDVEIYHKAAAWVVRHNEFYQAEAGQWTLDALDRGLLRARQVGEGSAPWLNQRGHSVVRAYRSRVDDSVQPYAVTLPADYGKALTKKWRVDVVLHGRDRDLTEVKFLHDHAGDKAAPKGQDFVRLDIYGRGNLGYRWAGEVDVLDALDSFAAVENSLGRAPLLDPNRVVLRGFSMGGAGTWSLGLHVPGRWCLLGPGAGFTSTHGYVPDLPDKLPSYQEACLHIYDAADYAENVFNVPVVAYAGSKDRQLQAARNIEDRLKPLKIPMTLLVAPGLGHAFPPEWQKKAEKEYARYTGAAKDRNPYADRVRFVTYTLKYPTCGWVEIIGMDRHYEKTVVDAEKTEDGFKVTTANVEALKLTLPGGATQKLLVQIDGQDLHARPSITQVGTVHVYLEKRDGRWKVVLPEKLLTERLRRPQKMASLQGPIDDAFTASFLCVRGTGKAWHEGTGQYADANLKRFQQEWDKYQRGELPIKDDIDVGEEDIAGRHLILFGDPASNSLIAQVLDGLPLQWTKEQIRFGGRTYAADAHVPVLIYPSPLNANRLVVLNSGHTFHARDFQGSNALLYPRLGDYAVLKLAPTAKDPLAVEVAAAGLFDEYWRIPKTDEQRK